MLFDFCCQSNPTRALQVLTTFTDFNGGHTANGSAKARLLGLLNRQVEQLELLRACREAGGELGPPELELLKRTPSVRVVQFPSR